MKSPAIDVVNPAWLSRFYDAGERADPAETLPRYRRASAEPAIQLAEVYGYQIARLLQGVLEGLQLTAAQRKFAPEVVRANLLAIDGGDERSRRSRAHRSALRTRS